MGTKLNHDSVVFVYHKDEGDWVSYTSQLHLQVISDQKVEVTMNDFCRLCFVVAAGISTIAKCLPTSADRNLEPASEQCVVESGALQSTLQQSNTSQSIEGKNVVEVMEQQSMETEEVCSPMPHIELLQGSSAMLSPEDQLAEEIRAIEVEYKALKTNQLHEVLLQVFRSTDVESNKLCVIFSERQNCEALERCKSMKQCQPKKYTDKCYIKQFIINRSYLKFKHDAWKADIIEEFDVGQCRMEGQCFEMPLFDANKIERPTIYWGILDIVRFRPVLGNEPLGEFDLHLVSMILISMLFIKTFIKTHYTSFFSNYLTINFLQRARNCIIKMFSN